MTLGAIPGPSLSPFDGAFGARFGRSAIGAKPNKRRPVRAAAHSPPPERNAVDSIDTRTTPLQPLPDTDGTTVAIKQGSTWTRNGTAGHRDDARLERTRARWLEPGDLASHEPGWYIETTGADGRPVARTGPFDTLAVEYQIENTWMFELGYDTGGTATYDDHPGTDQATQDRLSEQATEITRLGLDLRIHEAATRWTDAIQDAQQKLADANPTEPAPTIAQVLHQSHRNKDQVHLAYNRLVAATNAKHRWINA